MKVVAGHRGVHLHRQFGFMGPFNRVQSSLPGPGDAPETIVQLRRGAIQAQRQTHQAALLQLEDRLTGKQRSGTRGQ